jgi:hypothetical protein
MLAVFIASSSGGSTLPTETRIRVKIVLWALVLALAWTAALIIIARSVGLHSTPGMWTGAIGLPGVVIANWMQAKLFRGFHRSLGYTLMFLINWGFYCSVLQGIISLKRRIWVE